MRRSREAGFVVKTLALARKDLRIEMRGRETLLPMVFFAAAVTLLLAFTLPGSPPLRGSVDLPLGALPTTDVVAGFLWITVLFAGLIGFARTFEIEREESAIESLMLVPLDRSGLYASKGLANLVFVVMVEVVIVPAFAVFFGLRLGANWAAFLLVVALVDVGFVAVGTLFASIAAQTRNRELILPILSLPALVPVFIAAVELTSTLFAGNELEAVASSGWFGILAGFDLLFGAAGALLFDLVID